MSDSRIIVVGMAGGIAGGKTLVAGMLRELGAVVLNADDISHAVLRTPAVIEKVKEKWGTEVLDPEGNVDRGKLGARVFGDGEAVRELERIVHPEVIRRIDREIESRRGTGWTGVVVIDAPLLFEAGLDQRCDWIVFVDSPEEMRTVRVKERRGWSAQELSRRERRQKSSSWKRERADTVIENRSSIEEVRRQVEALWVELSRRVQES